MAVVMAFLIASVCIFFLRAADGAELFLLAFLFDFLFDFLFALAMIHSLFLYLTDAY